MISALLFTCLFLNINNIGSKPVTNKTEYVINYKVVSDKSVATLENQTNKIVTNIKHYKIDTIVIPTHIVEINMLTIEEIDLISRVVMAEAEDEPLEGKIYVIDTILNRVDSKHFPNTVYKVIYQPSQFTSMWNGRYNRCASNNELNELIKDEYKHRKNNEIVFFTADNYGQYGHHSFRVGNHYFSTYNEEE